MLIENDIIPARISAPRGRERSILVFGATGQQGGAVVTALLADGWAVKALVRNPANPKAKELARSGASVVAGDMADPASVRAAMAGAYGVFSVQPSSGQGAAYDVSDQDEFIYGVTIADLARVEGVRHLVYTSVAAAGKGPTGMGHFDTKTQIEEHIRNLGLANTIIRPATFMELLTLPGMGLEQGRFTFFLRPDQAGQFIAVSDIGRIVATIFTAPDRFVGRTIDVSGDELTGAELGRSLSRAAGRTISYRRFPDSVLEANSFLRRLAGLVDDGRLAGSANLVELEREFGGLLTLDAWLAGPGRLPFLSALVTREVGIALR
jgi:uncharacterized protein YbjT (DUF2867 family)